MFFSPVLNWWIVTRHDDAMAVLMDPKRFPLVEPRLADVTLPPALAGIAPEGYTDPLKLISDPQTHLRMRRLTIQSFKPHKIEARETEVREVADRLIDAFAGAGRTDLVASLAVPLPLLIFMRIFGLPEADAGRIEQWSNNYLRLTMTRLEGEAALSAWRQDMEYYRYIQRLVEERRESPREDDLITDLIRARDEETSAFTTTELVKFIHLLVIAGNETTRQTIGTLILRLLEHPEQLAAVRADPSLAGAAVEEALRHSGPVPGGLRSPTEDVQLGGVSIPKGQTVMVLNSSANRDAAAFQHPDEFDLYRKDVAKHLAFSKGVHVCLGAPLARLEARVALQRVLARLPGLRRANDAPPQWNPSMIIGLARLDVEWDVINR